MGQMAKDPGIVALRIREIMADRMCDQSDLAESVGISQSAISQILNGLTRNSRHLPKIADALAINLSYLAGTSDERIDMFDENGERMSEDDLFRKGLGRPESPRKRQTTKSMSQPQVITLPVLMPSEAALRDLLRGILSAVPEGASKDETAEILARRFPTALAANGPLVIAPGAAPSPEGDEALQSPATDHPEAGPSTRT